MDELSTAALQSRQDAMGALVIDTVAAILGAIKQAADNSGVVSAADILALAEAYAFIVAPPGRIGATE